MDSYKNELLKRLVENPVYQRILEALSEHPQGLMVTQIGKIDSIREIRVYVRDKAIAALAFAGLIEQKSDITSLNKKVYVVSTIGKEILSMLHN